MASSSAKPTVFATAACFAAYVVLTAIQIAPVWASMSGTEQITYGKQLFFLVCIVGFFVATPRAFWWGPLLWGVVVPLKEYAYMLRELLDGALGAEGRLATLDELRLVSLFVGTCLSSFVFYQLHLRKAGAPPTSNENA
jgi:hypothetical protein